MIAPHNLIAASILPKHVSAKSRDNTKRIHYALGLGDGNMHSTSSQHESTSQQGLRGMKIRGIIRDDPNTANNINKDETKRFNLMPVVGTDDADLKEFLRRGADRRAAAIAHRQEVAGVAGGSSSNELHQSTSSTPFGPASDASWQISFIMMLGIFAILVGLFIHFSTDPGHTTTYLRMRTKKKPNFATPRSSYRKKTDEWSEDEEVTEDDSYGADNEGPSGSSIATKRTNVSPQPPDDPTARLYYNLNTGDTNFREQEHRLRRSANHQSSNVVDPYQSTPTRASSSSSMINSRGGAVTAGGVNKMDRSPRGSTISRASTMQTSNHAAAAAAAACSIPTLKPSPPPPPFDASGLGSGLEGFETTASSPDDSNHNFEAWAGKYETVVPSASPSNNEPAVLRRHLVKPMGPFTPTESFSSMDVVAVHAAQIKQDDTADMATAQQSQDPTTPPLTSEEYDYSSPDKMPEGNTLTSPFRSQSIPFSSPRRSYPVPFGGEFADLPTPRVDHTTAKKKELAKILRAKGKDLPVPPMLTDGDDDDVDDDVDHINPTQNDFCPTISTSDAAPNVALSHSFPELPLVPCLDHSIGDSPRSGHTGDAPRSVLLEELQLVRMESGVSGPKWRTNIEVDDTSPLESGGQSFQHPMFGHEKNAWYEVPDAATAEMKRQETENLEKLKQASESIDPADDPRNSIQHIRKDLTISSHSSSSLSSKITFSELKLEDVIGGGGFGQVWRAKWKGTPVAVKVLTGTAQAEKIPKAVLEEFIGEINMVSGMRHPNICLFMGACLDAPNRAIVTELCENGSLWDALRLPLASPYKVADGVTRDAWPLELYEQIHSPPRSSGDGERPIVPKGVWPWYLVKRVASGTARGMCYLHSGNPPVLHRDLKSANILLDESYTAKLADFGLSRLKAVRSGMTGNCGTVQWMAPEVLCSEDYAEPADVFSYGIILWEMLTQECPYEGMTPIQCALAVLNQNHRPEIPAWCPQPFRALIKNCVERDPKARPTFPQILQALDALP
jgi:serine/threonine protein kinase